MVFAMIHESQVPQHLDPLFAARQDHPTVRGKPMVGKPSLSLPDLRGVNPEGFRQVFPHPAEPAPISDPDPTILCLAFGAGTAGGVRPAVTRGVGRTTFAAKEVNHLPSGHSGRCHVRGKLTGRQLI